MDRNIVIASLLFFAVPTNAQTQKQITKADYDRAVSMLPSNVGKYVDNMIYPHWLPNGELWYRRFSAHETKYVLYNPVDGKKRIADSKAELLKTETVSQISPEILETEVLSPDGEKVAFVRNWNLWIKDLSTNEETALTTDGVENFGYATNNVGWTHSDKPVLKWSPDSKRIASFQQDQRHINSMFLVKTKVGLPELEEWKYPLPGDSSIIQIYRIVVEVSESPKVVRLKLNADAKRSTLLDDLSDIAGFDDNEWSEDSKRLAFVSTSRDHKQANLRIADAQSGEVIDVIEEKVPTRFESGQFEVNWRFLSKTSEIIWYSARTDWGHLYLYDALTGKLKNQITSGNFVVTKVLKVDASKRIIYFEAKGKETGRNPYFAHYYSIDFDGKNLVLLTPSDGNHAINFSPDGKYFVDTYSQPNVLPVTDVRDLKGKLLTTLEKSDITRLKATGWKAPMPFTVNSADKRWDLYGLMFKPIDFNPSIKYPVIVYIYPGPQGGSIDGWSFLEAYGDNQALAELGFIVIALEGSCNPNRSKSFQDACYGNMSENTLPDQIAGLKQLAEKYSFLDLNKVGIWGHSGGGFAAASAMFKYPDFFKVGISESGNHDSRNYVDDWGERYIGLETKDKKEVSNYEQHASHFYAKNLKGKLLLVHGGLDDNVPPYNTYLVADALIKANKDFDFLIFPNASHNYDEDFFYMIRKRWDYFVQHLLQATAPKEYKIEITPDPRSER